MSDKVQSSGGGIGFLGLLTILFVALKLTGFVTWSWIWVLAPLWLVPLSFIAIVLSLFAVASVIEAWKRK